MKGNTRRPGHLITMCSRIGPATPSLGPPEAIEDNSKKITQARKLKQADTSAPSNCASAAAPTGLNSVGRREHGNVIGNPCRIKIIKDILRVILSDQDRREIMPAIL